MIVNKEDFVTGLITLIILGTLVTLIVQQEKKRKKEQDTFNSAVSILMEETFNAVYPDPTISFLGSQSPDYQKTINRQSELKKVFMSGEERFLERRFTTPSELSEIAAKGRLERFKVMCRAKPQQGCPY